jgi:hypothetical protein
LTMMIEVLDRGKDGEGRDEGKVEKRESGRV